MSALTISITSFLILYILTIMLIAGSISAFIWRKKLRTRLLHILGVVLGSPVIVMIILFVILFVGTTLFDNFGSGYYSSDPEQLSVDCPNLGKITGHINYSGDKPYYYNMIQFLKKNNGQTFLLNEYESGWGGNNSKIFNKYQGKNSTLGNFPNGEFLKQGFNFVPSMNKYENSSISKSDLEIPPRGSSDNIKNTKEAVFIHPSKMTKEEFKVLTECVSSSQQGKLNPVSEYKFKEQEQLNYLFNSRIFVYGEPFVIKNNVYLNKYPCTNSKYSIYTAPSGILKLISESKDSEFPTLGSIDEKGKINREKDYTKAVSSFYGKKQGFSGLESTYHFQTSDVSFTKTYQESQTLKLLFNEKQEPIDDYLKTCKNSQGKTVFDIFKAS